MNIMHRGYWPRHVEIKHVHFKNTYFSVTSSSPYFVKKNRGVRYIPAYLKEAMKVSGAYYTRDLGGLLIQLQDSRNS